MKLSEYIKRNGDYEVAQEKPEELFKITQSCESQFMETYYYITDIGEVKHTAWNSKIVGELLRFELGNVFKTKEAAEAKVQWLKTHAKLKHFAEEHNECNIDWKNEEQLKWFIVYDYEDEVIFFYNDSDIKNSNIVYFTSLGIVRQAVEEIGEEEIEQYLLYEG